LTEIPGNGLDDDCNAATPDTLPADSLACSLVTDKRSYDANSLAQLTATVQNVSASLAIGGLEAQFSLEDPGGQSVFNTDILLDTLSPNALTQPTVGFNTETRAPGEYRATLDLVFGQATVCQAEATFNILSSAAQGTALAGEITTDPGEIVRGENTTFSYEVRNVGNEDLSAVTLTVLVVNLATGNVVETFTDQISLLKGAAFASSKSFNSTPATAGDHLVILQGESSPTQTLDADFLTIMAAAPVADAGPDRNVATGEEVALNGSGSFDPNGDLITYEWSLENKPAGSSLTNGDISGRFTPNPSIIPDADGSYVLRLVTRDQVFESLPDTVELTSILQKKLQCKAKKT